MEDNFKRLVYITFFFIFVLMLFSSFNDPYPIPEYIVVYETETIIIKYSREIYHDIYGIAEETTDQVYKRYEGIDDISFIWSKKNYLDSRPELKENIKWKIDSIMWKVHPNYIETLDKHCVKEHEK